MTGALKDNPRILRNSVEEALRWGTPGVEKLGIEEVIGGNLYFFPECLKRQKKELLRV